MRSLPTTLIPLLAIILLFTSLSSIALAQSRPVIFIPGVTGTKLCDANKNIIWGDRYSYTAGRLRALRLPISFDA